MNGRDRFLAAIHRQPADHLPCQVHGWMDYYLRTFLGGCDQYAAYERFGMDPVIYGGPSFSFNARDLADWQVRHTDTGIDASGNHTWVSEVTTPSGTLISRGANNEFTGWETEHLVKNERDFEIWVKHKPVPVSVDWGTAVAAKNRIGERGILRGSYFDFGQGSPWQSFCIIIGTQPAIMAAQDQPEWVHHVLQRMLDKKLRVIAAGKRFELDLVEIGGGAGSNTVISPRMFREFCLPYDRQQIQALHAGGTKVVYHLCGGLMHMLEMVAETGADGLETMTPPAMGGDCDLAEAYRRVGDRLFFIGGFDQNRGFEKGDPKTAKAMVHELHACCPRGGYICSPSDHFFFGNPENLQAFADAAKECRYG
jgi:hypothetical protein